MDDELLRLFALLRAWREPGLTAVPPRLIVPDATNREQTLLSVEHVHFIAGLIRDAGFAERSPDGSTGHDVPVLVRACAGDELGEHSLNQWRRRCGEHAGFPACGVANEPAWFTSLGNGHFCQALNCFRLQWPSLFEPGGRYTVSPSDAALTRPASLLAPQGCP